MIVVFIAQGKGFFASNGLNAVVEVRNTGRELTTSLQAGDIDFAPAAFTNLPVALERGLELTGVVGYLGSHFNKPTHDSNVGIIAHPDSGVTDVGRHSRQDGWRFLRHDRRPSGSKSCSRPTA